MKTNLISIKKDIAEGTCTRIYYSTRTCWWTHNDADVLAAMEVGAKLMEKNHEAMMADPAVSEQHKIKANSLWQMIKGGTHKMPLDPKGNVLMQADNPLDFIARAEANPMQYGRCGLQAFLLAHHQNIAYIYQLTDERA